MKIYIQKVLITLGLIAAFIIVPYLLYYVLPFFTPFIIAYLFALMLEPLNQWLTKKGKISRILAANISYFLFIAILSLLSYFMITRIVQEIIGLVKFIQRNMTNIEAWFLDMNRQIQDLFLLLPEDVKNQINTSLKSFFDNLATTDLLSTIGLHTINLTAAIPNFFVLLILAFISLYLITLHLPQINAKWFSYFKESSKRKLDLILIDLRKATIGFIHAQIIISSITYVITSIALTIIGVHYAFAIAFIIILVDILPILGTGSVLVPWAIVSLTRGDLFLAIGLMILYLVIIVVRRIIEPKILGERIGLSPLATLISIWIGFKVLGVVGLFLGPIAIILFNALRKADVIRLQVKI